MNKKSANREKHSGKNISEKARILPGKRAFAIIEIAKNPGNAPINVLEKVLDPRKIRENNSFSHTRFSTSSKIGNNARHAKSIENEIRETA
jgi:hypothetical protein